MPTTIIGTLAQLGFGGTLILVFLLGWYLSAKSSERTIARWERTADKQGERSDEAIQQVGELAAALRSVEALVKAPVHRDAA